MFKILIILALTLLTILPNILCAESGIKISFDSQLLNLLKKVDINSKVANMTLIDKEGLIYEKKNFPSVYMKIINLTIHNIKTPNPENTIIENDNANKILQIKLKNFEVELKASYDLKIATILNDQGKNSLIKIEIDQFMIGFQFTNDKILIKSFDFKIKKVNFEFNNWVLNLLKKLFMSEILKQVHKSVDTFKQGLEEKLNNSINNKFLIDLGGMGIGINSTITEHPNMEVFEINSNKKYLNKEQEQEQDSNLNSNLKSLEKLNSQTKAKRFLTENLVNNLENNNNNNINFINHELKSFLSLGIRGEIFATIMKDLKPKISEPTEMKFNQRLNKNGVRLLLSDYTINTVLFFGQQSGAIAARITNDTNAYLPFNSDIDGFKSLFPKLTEIYKENFPVELKINCGNDLKQPQITTHIDGSKLYFNLAFELKVYNSTDIFDEPITEILLDFDGHLLMQYMFDENEIFHVIVFKTVIENLNKQKDNISINDEDLKNNIAKIMDNIINVLKPSFSNIKAGEIFRNTTGYVMENIEFDTRNEYMELAFDLKEQ
jgi:hypothetical protein